MTDEPQPPPGPGDDRADRDIEALADQIAADEAEEAEQADAEAAEAGGAPDGDGADDEAAGPSEWDGSAARPAGDKGPSKLALVAVALVALIAGAGTAYALGHKGGSCPAKGDAIKVEGTRVPTAEYQRRLELLRALYDVRPPDDAAKLAAFRGDAAKGMAVAVLVSHDVEKRHLQAADKTVRDGLDRFIAQRYPQGGRDQFIQALGNYGVSEQDVLDEFRRLLETRALFQAVTADVKVGEDQVAKTFDERKDQLAVPETRHLRHLVVKTEDDANKALARIKGPETFEQVAKDVSMDASTKDQGGDLGTVSQAQLDPAFGNAAFAAAKGATFGPVQTKNGWHVGLVETITPGHPVTLADVHDKLRDTLVAEAQLTAWRNYLAERIRRAPACYAKDNRPADPKAPPPDSTLTPPTTTP